MYNDHPLVSEKKPSKITIFADRILAATFLRLIPKFVTPNQITVFRFVSLPFILYFLSIGDYKIGGIIFAISAFSDALDGALARTRNQITEWGKLYDPLADKMLVGSVVALTVSKFINPYLAFAIIFFEFLIIAGAFYWRKYYGKEIQARMAGKIKMLFQSLGIIFIFIFIIYSSPVILTLAEIFLWVSLFFSVLSLIVYKSI
ncbi:MAG: CDP-alcohol phosphatidyltransferase family protein [Candidatus Paceibacterota bacterium]